MPTTDKPSRVLTSLRTAVETLARSGPLTAPELAKEIGIPRPSAYRLMGALIQDGLATQQPDGAVSLSTKWLHFGDQALATATPWFHHEELLRSLRDSSRLTVYLSVPRPQRTVCVRRLHGQGVQVLVLHPGGSLPLHLGGVGRITLAFGDEEPEEYLAAHHPERFTPRSLETRKAILDDVALSRERHYCISDEDVTVGVGAVAAPVLTPDGQFLAALSIAGRRDDIVGREKDLARQVQTTAAKIGDTAEV
ncbi:IclR family transcriptional regulator [Microbacterium sp. SSM24]|uniref:IclR family transcriptional regulator n=1 Tax=Microbacterium sp. SSM24 TaxID=2991714 RepID=UPI00222743A7|nr:IclR family transcriptional regulator [Microbacterium sp. SSM24]MCW3492716.1 IclR family transcriptional regulator [Microbacterium sp. SSM24]